MDAVGKSVHGGESFVHGGVSFSHGVPFDLVPGLLCRQAMDCKNPCCGCGAGSREGAVAGSEHFAQHIERLEVGKAG